MWKTKYEICTAKGETESENEGWYVMIRIEQVDPEQWYRVSLVISQGYFWIDFRSLLEGFCNVQFSFICYMHWPLTAAHPLKQNLRHEAYWHSTALGTTGDYPNHLAYTNVFPADYKIESVCMPCFST